MPKITSFSKYKKEYVQSISIYLKEVEKENKKHFDAKVKKVVLPTIERFALYLKVSTPTIYNWEKEKPAFKKALDKLRATEKTMLIENGLAGTYSPVIAKLILGNSFGMFENTNVRMEAKVENTFSDEQANRIADRIAGRKREIDNPSSTK